MPDFVSCLLEEIDQHGKSVREDIIINKYTLENSRLTLDDWYGRIAEVCLEDIVAIEQNGMHGISIKTMTGTMILKSSGQPPGDASLIDLKIKLLEFEKRSLLEKSNPGREQGGTENDLDTETIEAVIGRGDDRHDFYTMEANEEYIRGVSWDNFGELLVHKHDISEKTLIETVYGKEDQILSKGDRIMRLAEKRGKGGNKFIDIIYGGEDKICIHSIAAKGLEVGQDTEAMIFFLIRDATQELIKGEGTGVIRMPMPVVQTGKHPFIEIKWKADVGSIVEEGEAVCVVEIDDGEKSLGETRIDAPCRLCISSPRCNFDTEESVKIGGILMEYLRLPDKKITERKSGGKPQKESRRAAKISEPDGEDSDYASGIDWKWARKLLLDAKEDTVSIEVVKWYCDKNSLVSNGQAIVQVQEKRKNGDMTLYDVYYDGEIPVWIYSIKCKEQDDRKQTLDATGEICSVYLDIRQDESSPAEGEFGYIRMPFANDEMQLVSLVNWKAPVGTIIEKGKKICDVTILDWNNDAIEQCLLTAPCRLKVSSVDFDSSKTVFTNGILLEYLHLHEVAETTEDTQKQTTYRNSGAGAKEALGKSTGNIQAEAVTDAQMTVSSSVDYSGNFIKIKEKARVRVVALDGKTQPKGGRLTLILATKHGIELVCHNGKLIISAKKVVGIEKTSMEASGDTITIRTKNATFAIDYYGDTKELDSILNVIRHALIGENRTSPPGASSSDEVRRDTTYRNRGIGTEEVIGKTQTTKRDENPPNSSRPQGNSASSASAQDNQITEPIEGRDNLIAIVRDGYAFEVRSVLERIVTTEKERIENERGLWKLGAGVAAFAFGISLDGFDAGDLLAGWTFSNIGAAAHQYASKEQVEFLRRLQSEWLVLDRSPIDIRRRLGEPQGRFIGISRQNALDMFNIHQSGTRGFHMVELDYAGNIAKGFRESQSLEVLQRSYDDEDIKILSSQLYPSTITPLKLCRTITPEEARGKDPYFNQLSKAGAPFRVVYKDDTEGVMYKIQIPHHSDY